MGVFRISTTSSPDDNNDGDDGEDGSMMFQSSDGYYIVEEYRSQLCPTIESSVIYSGRYVTFLPIPGKYYIPARKSTRFLIPYPGAGLLVSSHLISISIYSTRYLHTIHLLAFVLSL